MVTVAPAQTSQGLNRLAQAKLAPFMVGQTLEAVVLGQASNGLTLLKVGDAVVAAQLPELLPAGTTLQLQVKLAGTSPHLTIVGQGPGGGEPTVVGTPPELVKALPALIIAQVRPAIADNAHATIATTIDKSGQVVAARLSGNDSGSSKNVSLPGGGRTSPVPERSEQLTSPSLPIDASVELDTGVKGSDRLAAAGEQGLRNGAGAAGSPATGPLPAWAAAGVQGDLRPSAATASTLAMVGVDEIEASPLLVAQETPRLAVAADFARTLVPSVPASTGAPPLPQTPAAALLQMMPEAMARQDSIAPLLLSLAALVGRPTGLPEPIVQAALTVLATRIAIPGDEVPAETLAKGIAQSGVFLEAGLAKSHPPGPDLKAALLGLREMLARVLGDVATSSPAMTHERAPPPVRGLPPRAFPTEAPPLPDAPREMARLVHAQADAAVSRIKLLQLASLPDAPSAQPARTEMRLELPLLIGHELVMMQIQIARDGGRREAERKRGWSLRFAMNFAATGEVGADVGLLGNTVNVALWAGDAEVAEQFGAALPQLGPALEAVGLRPGALHVRRGAPEAGRLPSGRLLDSVS